MEERPPRCAIYIRVSTAEQMIHGKSLESQKNYLAYYANTHRMEVVGIYADEGKTARRELKKRKAIHALLEDVRAGRVDVILFWRLDRWFRSLSDFYKVQDILDEYGVRWISASEPGLNMETREGRLQLNVVLSIGQNEVDTTSERIRFVNEASVRQGKAIFGQANMPRGYKPGIVDGKKCMIKDPEMEEMVNAFFDHYEKHQSKQETLRYIQKNYDPSFTYSSLRTMLSSEFYKGTYRGIPYCPAYLTEERWNRLQRLSQQNVRHAPSGRVYYFSGLIRCPLCGHVMSGTGSRSVICRKTGEKRDYCYYRCSRAFTDHICENTRRPSQLSIEARLLEHLEEEFRGCKIHVTRIRKQKPKPVPVRTAEQIDRELSRLGLLFQKGRITWDYYDQEYRSLREERERSDTKAPQTEEERSDYSDLAVLLEGDLQTIYHLLTPQNKQAFWRNILRQIRLDPDCAFDSAEFL